MPEHVNIEHNGFTISVLPVLEYGPPPENPKFSYSAFVCRPENIKSKEGGKHLFYGEAIPIYTSEAAALAAGQQKGMQIVDGGDPEHSIKHL